MEAELGRCLMPTLAGIASGEAFGRVRLPGQSKMSRCMDGLAGLCSELVDNAYPWPVPSITVPCVVVGYPTKVDFDMTFQRGADTFEFPLWYVVGLTNSKDARDALSDVLSDAVSVKAMLDGAHAFGDVRVTDATVAEITIASVTYLSVKFNAEVFS